MSLRRSLLSSGLIPCGLVLSLVPQGDVLRPERAGAESEGIECVEPRLPRVFEGIVFNPNGAPAIDAVVVSSAGGRVVTDAGGSYRLEVDVPLAAQSIRITVVGGGGGNLVASTSVELSAASGDMWLGPLELTETSSCDPSWLPTFGGQPGVDSTVRALEVFDDGSGPALYVGGDFTTAGGILASGVAKWDGSSWAPLGSGIGAGGTGTLRVDALEVFDDGSGPALYAAGAFLQAGEVAANRIARWNGTSWSALGSGMSNDVFALTVFDDGSGPALYAGGWFSIAGGMAASRIARWNGSSWSALGSGTNGGVFALTVFDDGSGPALYAGGLFTSAGGVTANDIARWDGTSWAPLSSGVNSYVFALTVFDDGHGPALYAGGEFTTAGGGAASRIARWDGSNWAALGTGTNDDVDDLAVFDDGTGPALYAGGAFTTAGGVATRKIARWDGSSWTALGGGMAGPSFAYVLGLAEFDDGSGPALYSGGIFGTAGGVGAKYIARWDGSTWTSLDDGLDREVYALMAFDDGTGPALYAGGGFASAGAVATSYIAKWDGASWTALGSGVNWNVYALAVYDDGSGPELYAGGLFNEAGGASANFVAKWDGTSWSALGSGVVGGITAPFPSVYALAVYDDGSGPALYAGGAFLQAGGVAANGIARWNGSSWSALGSGTNSDVLALTVYDDGSGPALYAGGWFTAAGGASASRVAKWNGSSWAALGTGVSGGPVTNVQALTVFDDGTGPALYAGGSFTSAGGMAAKNVAKWGGAVWMPLASGMNAGVSALAVFQGRAGPELHAGGSFTTTGEMAANRIAMWDGSSWAPLGSGVSDAVNSFAVFNDRTGPALHAGGLFGSAFDSHDSYLAKWGCRDTTAPVISCPTGIVVGDLAGPPGEDVTFVVTASDEEDYMPSVLCSPPSGSHFPRGTTLVTCTATDFSGNQATCQFPVTVTKSHFREIQPQPH